MKKKKQQKSALVKQHDTNLFLNLCLLGVHGFLQNNTTKQYSSVIWRSLKQRSGAGNRQLQLIYDGNDAQPHVPGW